MIKPNLSLISFSYGRVPTYEQMHFLHSANEEAIITRFLHSLDKFEEDNKTTKSFNSSAFHSSAACESEMKRS